MFQVWFCQKRLFGQKSLINMFCNPTKNVGRDIWEKTLFASGLVGRNMLKRFSWIYQPMRFIAYLFEGLCYKNNMLTLKLKN